MHTDAYTILSVFGPHHLPYRNWLYAGNLLPQITYKSYSFISLFKRYRPINPQYLVFFCEIPKPLLHWHIIILLHSRLLLKALSS